MTTPISSKNTVPQNENSRLNSIHNWLGRSVAYLKEHKSEAINLVICAGLAIISYRCHNWTQGQIGVLSTTILVIKLFSYVVSKTDYITKSKAEIEEYTENLVQLVRDNRLDSCEDVLFRDKEVNRLISILCMPRKSNAMLIGPAGCGKTALVRTELAKRIAKDDVPHFLKNKEILSLNLAALKANSIFHGMYEGRINNLIKYLNKNPNTILFIDEIHMIMTNPNTVENSGNLANFLKAPLLQRMTCIGATTEDEYNQYISPDPAFARRFQLVQIGPLSAHHMLQVLKASKDKLQKDFSVTLDDAILEKTVHCAAQIPHRVFPDKGKDLLESACAAVKMEQRTRVEPEDIEEAFYQMKDTKNTEHLTMYT